MSRLRGAPAVATLCALTLLSSAPERSHAQMQGKGPASIPTTSIAAVSAGLSGTRTSVQRDAFWETVKGKEVRWVIEVFEVVPGWFSGYYIRGSASPTLAVSCELEGTPMTKTIAEKINIGDKVVCSGKLGDPTMVLFGQAAVSVKGAAIAAR
jgi:hypothetical protein